MDETGSADRRFRGPRLFPKVRKQCWAGDPRTGENIRPAPNSKLAEPRRPPAGRAADRKTGGPRYRLAGCGFGAWWVGITERSAPPGSAPPRRSERHPSSSEEGSYSLGTRCRRGSAEVRVLGVPPRLFAHQPPRSETSRVKRSTPRNGRDYETPRRPARMRIHALSKSHAGSQTAATSAPPATKSLVRRRSLAKRPR